MAVGKNEIAVAVAVVVTFCTVESWPSSAALVHQFPVVMFGVRLPKSNLQYSSVDYWNYRYESEDAYEWFKGYASFRHIILDVVKPADRILMLGCGNSSLSEDMYFDGFHNIVNVDYSAVVIDKMRSKSADCTQMQWLVMDAKNLSFPDAYFDVVIEKGTLDAMLVAEKDPWHVSDDTEALISRVLSEVQRVVRPSGHFVSITFGQPHFRRKLYDRECYDWSFEYRTFGEAFHYFVYIMRKGRPLSPSLVNTKAVSNAFGQMSLKEDNLNYLDITDHSDAKI